MVCSIRLSLPTNPSEKQDMREDATGIVSSSLTAATPESPLPWWKGTKAHDFLLPLNGGTPHFKR